VAGRSSPILERVGVTGTVATLHDLESTQPADMRVGDRVSLVLRVGVRLEPAQGVGTAERAVRSMSAAKLESAANGSFAERGLSTRVALRRVEFVPRADPPFLGGSDILHYDVVNDAWVAQVHVELEVTHNLVITLAGVAAVLAGAVKLALVGAVAYVVFVEPKVIGDVVRAVGDAVGDVLEDSPVLTGGLLLLGALLVFMVLK